MAKRVPADGSKPSLLAEFADHVMHSVVSERATLRASEHVPGVLFTPVQHRVHINVERHEPA